MSLQVRQAAKDDLPFIAAMIVEAMKPPFESAAAARPMMSARAHPAYLAGFRGNEPSANPALMNAV